MLAPLGLVTVLFALELRGGLAGGFLADLADRSLLRHRSALLWSARGPTAIENGGQTSVLGEAPAQCRRALENHAKFGHRRGDHVRIVRLVGDALMEEVTAGAQASKAAFIDGAAIARS
ncbi:hypothetical protein [Bradyrhizobium sp. 143]|uniref:hypothetical protein n=1 Tax=unclassified Bradyrhizobium TaxID=2631580 RepID=UPI0032081F86|nr:hypothetical protein [Bradyrhizobium sp. 143]MCK1730549.1 hypothetical protein [Bradyrhizobium sp. 142]